MRALVLKDTRVFWRDPAQWTQVMIFFGLLTIYVLNLRNVAYDLQSKFWSTMISYLNLTACALTLSTLTTRFVFPQFSLEGRRLWILGLAPLGLGGCSCKNSGPRASPRRLVTVGLMIASSVILKLEWTKIVYFAGAIALMSGALCGLAVGLGALFPNFKEENPSKIVSGFGGTLCLVASFFTSWCSSRCWRFRRACRSRGRRWRTGCAGRWSGVSLALALGLSALASVLPLALGRRRLRAMEF